MKTILLTVLLLGSSFANADVIESLNKLGNIINNNVPKENRPQLQRAFDKLANDIYSLQCDDGSSSKAIYSAACHVDDDAEFDADQSIIGTLRGSIDTLLADCKFAATARYGANSSSGLINIQIVQPVKSGVTGSCNVDNDVEFDAGQYVLGQLSATSLVEIEKECAKLSKGMFGNNSSSGVVGVK